MSIAGADATLGQADGYRILFPADVTIAEADQRAIFDPGGCEGIG